MSLKHTWTQQIKNDAGAAVASDSALVVLGEAEANFYVEVPPDSTTEVDLAVTVADIQSGFLFSDKAVTIKTNAVDATGGQTIELTAGHALGWNVNMADFPNPFDPDITKFFIHNADLTATAKVRGGFLVGEVA